MQLVLLLMLLLSQQKLRPLSHGCLAQSKSPQVDCLGVARRESQRLCCWCPVLLLGLLLKLGTVFAVEALVLPRCHDLT